jgi:hypothetical protein
MNADAKKESEDASPSRKTDVELDLGSGRISWRTTRHCGELLVPVIEELSARYGILPRDLKPE